VALGVVLAGLALLFLATEAGPEDAGLEGLLTGLGSGAVVLGPLMLQWAGQPSWRALDNRPLHWLGRRSYGIYLFHLFVVGELPHVLAGPTRLRWLELVVLTVVLSSAAAALSWRFIEQPFLRRRAPWRRSAVRRREAAP
jgi:peptidoglycan/LPS O-acetylase OafA/YrhL